MNLEKIKQIIMPFMNCQPLNSFDIDKSFIKNPDFRKSYNKLIREKVKANFGIYFWLDKSKEELIYVGMAGKIKNDGTFGDHTIQKRLIASRDKDKLTRKDIQTNDYLKK